jgi:hypothetical protein
MEAPEPPSDMTLICTVAAVRERYVMIHPIHQHVETEKVLVEALGLVRGRGTHVGYDALDLHSVLHSLPRLTEPPLDRVRAQGLGRPGQDPKVVEWIAHPTLAFSVWPILDGNDDLTPSLDHANARCIGIGKREVEQDW